MKKIVFLLLMVPTFVFAQENWLEQNMNLSDADSNHVKATVSGKAFEMMSYANPDSILNEEILELAKSVKGMLGYAELTAATVMGLETKIEKDKAFDEYAKIERKDEHMALFINQKDGVIKECIMLVTSNETNLAMSIYGDLDIRLFGEMYKLIPYYQMKELQQEKEND